jgi:hypothetical protein
MTTIFISSPFACDPTHPNAPTPIREEIMVRYFYTWTPLVIVVGTIVLLTIPYPALAVLTIASFLALKKLAWATSDCSSLVPEVAGKGEHLILDLGCGS